MDDNVHGSHVARIIAALKDNGKGVIGVAPKAIIMALRGLNSSGGTSDRLAMCIKYAADQGAQVLSNSWGGSAWFGISQDLAETIDYAHDDKDCVVVFAAGNDNSDVVGFAPAGYPKVITVAATDEKDEKCNFSNFGAGIDVAAPGGGADSKDGEDTPFGQHYKRVNILSLRSKDTDMYLAAEGYTAGEFILGDKYYRARGTSMACPFVSGVAALIRANKPALGSEEVRSLIRLSADDRGAAGKDDYFGYGRVNALKAIHLGEGFVGIISPAEGSFIRDTQEVRVSGSAFIPNSTFHGYALWYSRKDNPSVVSLTLLYIWRSLS